MEGVGTWQGGGQTPVGERAGYRSLTGVQTAGRRSRIKAVRGERYKHGKVLPGWKGDGS